MNLHALFRIILIALSIQTVIAVGDEPPQGSKSPLLSEQGAGLPVVIGGARQFDFVSRINGQSYRLMVAGPSQAEEQKAYPVLYVLDGSIYFAAAAQHIQFAPFARRYPYRSALVVGLGYPVEGIEQAGELGRPDIAGGLPGVDSVIRVLLEEVKPFVASRWNVDERQQSVFGKSGHGTTLIRLLLQHPTAFTNYIAADPPVWLYGLNYADLFPKCVSDFRQLNGSQSPNLLTIWSGTDDQSQELAKWLTQIPPDKIRITTVKFPDENHASLSLPALNRAIHFALDAGPNQAQQSNPAPVSSPVQQPQRRP